MKLWLGRILPIAFLVLAAAFAMSGCDPVVSERKVICEVVDRWTTEETYTDNIYTGDPSHGLGIPVTKTRDVYHLRFRADDETFERVVNRDMYEKAKVGSKWLYVRYVRKSGKVTYD